ncbi:neutral amino acid transporter A-like [Centruroides sculpturatus]|uniref:neutral amino acid transporter A-like n=1 Tax=Centruroides sculpturatus TaxID=218467 RepID=UPI000C6D8899|nr:neutral amino acid transporter A-like [Centruroides sculpturatus]
MLVIRAFRMIILPMLPCSIILGITSLGKSENRKLISYTVLFIVLLSLFASILGLTLAHLLKPGEKALDKPKSRVEDAGKKSQILDSFLDMLRNAIPDNIIKATFSQEYTATTELVSNGINSSSTNRSISTSKSLQVKEQTNFIGLLIVSLIMGLAMASLKDEVAQFRSIVEQFKSIIMKIVHYFVKILPIGMFFLMFQEGLKTESVLNLIYQLGWLILTEIMGLVIHQFIFLPFLYILIVRRNPFLFISSILPVFLTSFGTASSLATFPITLRCMEEDNKLNRNISRFILPLGMVVNMQGVCIDLTIVTIFLAQIEGVSVNGVSSLVLCLTVVLLAIASPAMPATGSPVFILTCLAVVNVESTSDLSLILSIFWITDRLSTIGNAVGDCYVAAFVSKLCDDKNVPITSVIVENNNLPPKDEEEMQNVKL